jgi:hypothetical protein
MGRKALSVGLACVLVGVLTGCGGGGTETGGGGLPTSPTPPAPTTASFLAIIDNGCTGRVSNVEVMLDGAQFAVLQGGGQAERQVTIGNHTLGARSREGIEWPTQTVNVPAAGATWRFTCDNVATSGTLEVTLDAGTCSAVSSAEVFVDGRSEGSVNRGGTLRTNVSFGTHFVNARSGDFIWSNHQFSVSATAPTYRLLLHCGAGRTTSGLRYDAEAAASSSPN